MNFLTDLEIEELIQEIKSGNNEAWETICNNFQNYIHKCCWKKLEKFVMSDPERNDLEEDLYMAEWLGFIASTTTYDPGKGKFLTYEVIGNENERRSIEIWSFIP